MKNLNVYMTTGQPDPSPPREDEETPEEKTDRDLEYIEED